MSAKRTISAQKVIRITIGLSLAILFMVALVSASRQQSSKKITGLNIALNDENDYSFLQTRDIEQMLITNLNIGLKQTSIRQLDLRKMEAIARTHPWVAKADVFVDSKHNLNVNITQREPIARIFTKEGNSYYMDSSLQTMPLSTGYAFPAPVFTGVPEYSRKEDSMDRNMKSKIAHISRFIGADSFWHAQITQIEVQKDQTFILIPLMGNQRIILGDTANLAGKLDNLLAFYQNIPDKIGWDKYETLDVRFSGQVIAAPSIGWTPPKIADTATQATLPPKDTVLQFVAEAKVPTRTEIESSPQKMEITKKAEKAVARTNSKPAAGRTKQDAGKEQKKQAPKYIYTGNNAGNR